MEVKGSHQSSRTSAAYRGHRFSSSHVPTGRIRPQNPALWTRAGGGYEEEHRRWPPTGARAPELSGPLTSATTPAGGGREEGLPRETCAVVNNLGIRAAFVPNHLLLTRDRPSSSQRRFWTWTSFLDGATQTDNLTL
jgi:hypothetical protein